MTRPSVLLVPLLLLLSAVLGLLWWYPNRPMLADVPMPAARFNAVSFSPFRAWNSPLTDNFPTAAEVDQDMALVATRSRAIRTYAAIEGNYDVAALAKKHGLKLWLGIWLGADRASNEEEMARGIALASQYPDTVERVIVGNEVLLRRDLPVSELIADIDRVKAKVKQPVTYADVWEFWKQFPEVAKHVDIVTIHLLPYWEDDPTGIDHAVAHVVDIYHQMVALFPGKPVAIGETGWPSRGRWRQDAAPSRVNQVLFLRCFIAAAQANHFDYNLIEAFDQVWKYQSEGTVGASWGLWTADRQPKFPLSAPVQEDPAWPWKAGASVLLGVVLLGIGLASAPALGARAQARLATLAMALGAALAFAWSGTVPIVFDVHLAVAAVVNLPAQLLLAVMLMARMARREAGLPLPPARTGAQATVTVQALLRLRLTRARLAQWRYWLFDDVSFVFVWTAVVMQLLLLFDPRYRGFPLPVFAVPLIAVAARALVGDLPRGGGGREEACVGLVLALCAVASAVREGPLNQQSLVWNAAALLLAAPPLLRCLAAERQRAARPA